MSMTCAEVVEVLEAFVDGELQAGPMRKVARHLARCEPCEAECRRLETLQSAVRDAILSEVGTAADVRPAWEAIASKLPGTIPWWTRVRDGLWTGVSGARDLVGGGRSMRGPLWLGGTLATVALALFVLWSGEPDPPQRIAKEGGTGSSVSFDRRVPLAEGGTAVDADSTPYASNVMVAGRPRIDRLETPGSVRVWSQPDSGALVIWVDEEGLSVEPYLP